MVDRDRIVASIIAKMPRARVEVTSDDGVHFTAAIWAYEFAGKSLLEQHRMVYDAIGDIVGRELHALQLITNILDDTNTGE